MQEIGIKFMYVI